MGRAVSIVPGRAREGQAHTEGREAMSRSGVSCHSEGRDARATRLVRSFGVAVGVRFSTSRVRTMRVLAPSFAAHQKRAPAYQRVHTSRVSLTGTRGDDPGSRFARSLRRCAACAYLGYRAVPLHLVLVSSMHHVLCVATCSRLARQLALLREIRNGSGS
jgi:hypothetical protein